MGRFYDISAGSLAYQSLDPTTGLDNPGALNVECDITAVEHDTSAGSGWVRVWGIGLQDISQAQYLLGQPFTMSAGMSPGLPLTHPEQQGVICQGLIVQAFGNWQGVNQTIDFQVTAGSTPNPNPGPNPMPIPVNLVFNVKKGGDVAQAMMQTLQTGFPNFPVSGMPSGYTVQEDMLSFYGSLEEFAVDMRRLTQRLKMDPAAIGIGLRLSENQFNMSDGSQPDMAGTINYEDLIGQPTWIGPNTLQTTLVMRGDLKVQQVMTLPETLVTNTAAGSGMINGTPASLTFSGASTIQKIRFVGNSRQADAASWVTVVDSYIGGGTT